MNIFQEYQYNITFEIYETSDMKHYIKNINTIIITNTI